MVKKIITEISEEDFRKLDLKVKRNERVVVSENIPGHPVCKFEMVEKSLNEILDNEIAAVIRDSYESEIRWLELPVTIAIHEDGGYYLDKFMNRFTGAQTYQFGFGIEHLYSTRDYYEMHGDYWRVRKDETRVIYRIKLSTHWLDEFVVKHKTETIDWPYNELPEGVSPDYIAALLCIDYDLIDGEFKEGGRYGRFIFEHCEHHIPVDKDGHKVEPAWKKDVKSVN